MAKSKREEYERQLEALSDKSSRELKNQGNIVRDTAVTAAVKPEPLVEGKKEKSVQKKKESRIGRPKQEDKTHVSVYVPDRILGDLQAIYKMSGCKSMNEYITSLLEKDVDANKDKIEKFKALIS